MMFGWETIIRGNHYTRNHSQYAECVKEEVWR